MGDDPQRCPVTWPLAGPTRGKSAGRPEPARSATKPGMPRTWLAWVLIVVVIVVGWQETPHIPGITNVLGFENPYFISSPHLIAVKVWDLMSGAGSTATIWGPLARTVFTAVAGTVAALVLGSLAGLVTSNYALLEKVLRPFTVLANAVPRIAIVPIIVLAVGSSAVSDAVTAFTVVFFLAFYNAAAGAASVPLEMIQNARLLGSGRQRIMWRVRWPYALAWTMAVLSPAVALGLVGTITAEVMTGSSGIGYQLVLGIDYLNSTLIFAIVTITAVTGLVLVLGSAGLRKVMLPWSDSAGGQ